MLCIGFFLGHRNGSAKVGQKTPPNSAMDAIALVKSLYAWCEKGYFPSKWWSDNKDKVAVVAQRHQ